MPEGRATVSVVIPTRNAATLLPECLATVVWADEIVVVDRFSTDDTEAVCRSIPKCRFFQREGPILPNQNYGFAQATSDWILRLDADERITAELSVEIQAILADPPVEVTGYLFWERIFIFERELKYGFGRKHFRHMLWRRSAGARYPENSEHDALTADGLWLEGRHGYLHYNYARVREYLDKMNYYTDVDVDRAQLPQGEPSRSKALIETLRAFYLYYLKWQGYRDGWVGLVDAGMRAIYQFVYWAKLRERWEQQVMTQR